MTEETVTETEPEMSARNDENAEYDTTQLRSSQYAHRVHRDYLAHVLRWAWAGRFIGDGKTLSKRVIEPGCGQDLPLFGVMRMQQSYLPDLYVGVDLNGIPWVRKRREGSYKWADVREKFNFVERWPELQEEFGSTFDLAVSFEVIEHMKVEHGDKYLAGIHSLLEPGGRMLLSTPVFNGKAAKNHIHEYEIPELQEKLEAAGFEVVKRWGTFASLREVKVGLAEKYGQELADELMAVYQELLEFQDNNLLACFLAPLVPDYSRNNVWLCRKPGGDDGKATAIPAEKPETVDEDMFVPRVPPPAAG